MLAPQLRETAPSSSAWRTNLTTQVVSYWRASAQSDNALTILADLKAALPNTQASPSLPKLFVLEAVIFSQKMLTPGGGLHADAGLSHISENDGTLFADQVVHSTRLDSSSRSRVTAKGTSLQLHGRIFFVDDRLNSCPVIHS